MNSHVRYSEADHNGLITPDALINYFQDCTMVHSELCGRGAVSYTHLTLPTKLEV